MSTAVLERPVSDPALPEPTLPGSVQSNRSLLGQDPQLASPARAPRRSYLALILGLVGATISFAGSWIPSFWGDEAASVLSAERSLPSLFAMLAHVDAVHGVYYLLLHGWISLFGSSELSVRLPSAIAAGFVVAGTVTLAGMLFDRRTAIASGIICAVLPQLTHMGVEARSYAMTMAVAVWLTVLFVRTLEKSPTRVRAWLPYALGLAAGIYLFLYFALIVLAHGVVVVLRRSQAATRSWLSAVAIAVAIASPVIGLALTQHGQLSFLAGRNYATPKHIFVSQWFGNLPLAIFAWALIAIALGVAVRTHDRRIPLLAGWLFLPVTVILTLNALGVPTYNMRYVAFCLPAAAILMARGLSAFRFTWVALIGVVLVGVLAVPSYLHERKPHGKDGGSDLRELAALVHSTASTGDAIVFSQDARPSRRPRLALDLYPSQFAGLSDVGLISGYADNAWLWDSVAPIDTLGAALATTTVVWAVEERGTHAPATVTALKSLGFHVVTKFHTHRETVYELTRETP